MLDLNYHYILSAEISIIFYIIFILAIIIVVPFEFPPISAVKASIVMTLPLIYNSYA